MQFPLFHVFDLWRLAQAVFFDRFGWELHHFVWKIIAEGMSVLLFSIFVYFSHITGQFYRNCNFFVFWKMQNFENL